MSQPLIGAPRDRVEGPEKVSGTAMYTGDVAVPDMLHAVAVPSTVGNGRIRSIDESRARAEPGVVEIMTHLNAPRVDAGKSSPMDSVLFLLQSDAVLFDRQPVAVVIADTFEQATHAADLLRIDYDDATPVTELDTADRYVPDEIFEQPAQHQRGNPHTVFARAPVTLEREYRTPTEHHNPMEPHATVAQWDGDRLTLRDSTQWVFGVRRRIAAVFGISPSHVLVIAPFVGGAFGGKGTMWSHVALAAMASKMVERPVKIVVTRPQMFGWVGHRPQTKQRLRIGAARDGKLLSLRHDVLSETSMNDEFIEPCAVFSRDLYAVDNYGMTDELARLNISKPTFQRAPGESTGSFATESAMDELAYELGIDPVELRLRNYSERQPNDGKPYSSKRLRECYFRAGEAFGWSRRNPKPRSMHRGKMLVGMGMATASRSVFWSSASVRVRMNPDGRVDLACGTIEQGTGSPTVYAQLAAEILEVPFEHVRFEYGDTRLPEAPLAAGSQTAGSVGSAVVRAATALRDRLHALGNRVPPEGIQLEIRSEAPSRSDSKYATQSFGAHFAEVEVDPDVGEARVTRFVGAFDGGRILNAKTARSQYLGGIVWGISMALFEDTRYDKRTARIMSANLADYLIPTNADVPDVEIIMIEEDDPANPAHVKGIGEVAMTGSAAAVANAVFHATGIRVRDLPITPDKLIA
jgi:xanthine dehydrogenase YagR molybdenum-binding subunit